MKVTLERISWKQGDEFFKIDCMFRRSSRARRINLKLSEPKKVILTLPPWSSLQEGREFIITQGRWIIEKSKKISIQKSLADFFKQGAFIWLDEKPRKLNWFVDSQRKNSGIEIESDHINLFFNCVTDLENELLLACMKMAKKALPIRLRKCEAYSGLFSKRSRVGNQKSRWGSCSEKKTISLNWRLILLPFPIGQYVIFHELVHLEHMNHSQQFWNHLQSLLPDTKNLDKELSEVGREVIRLGQVSPWSQ